MEMHWTQLNPLNVKLEVSLFFRTCDKLASFLRLIHRLMLRILGRKTIKGGAKQLHPGLPSYIL